MCVCVCVCVCVPVLTARVGQESNIKDRRKKLQRLIELNLELKRLNNLHAVAAISAGINTAAIHRMKFTSQIDKKIRDAEADLETLMAPDYSYKNYRAAIHSINPPCVPFIGVYLRDLVFIEDGNPDNDEKGLINLQKRRLVATVIEEITQYQNEKYSFSMQEPVTAFVSYLPVATDETCYELSLQREPRGCTEKDLK